MIKTVCVCGNADSFDTLITVGFGHPNTSTEALIGFRDDGSPTGQSLVRCHNCGLVRTLWRQEDYDKLYLSGAYDNRLGEDSYTTRQDHDKEVGGFRIEAYHAHRRVLDVGAANGGFLLAASEAGYTVEGLEINPFMAAWTAQSIGALIHTTWDTVGDEFDMITYHDVLEHTVNPLLELHTAVKHLAINGLLFIDVPDIADPRFEVLGGLWHHLKPSEHMWFFDETTLRTLVESVQSLRVQSVESPILGKLVLCAKKVSNE